MGEIKYPTSDLGGYNFTSANPPNFYTEVDDVWNSPDNGATKFYGGGGEGGASRTFNCADSAFSLPTITNVLLVFRAKLVSGDAPTHGIYLLSKVPGGMGSTNIVVSAEEFAYYFANYPLNPNTNAAWTNDEINGVGQASNSIGGFGVTKGGGNGVIDVDQFLIAINMIPQDFTGTSRNQQRVNHTPFKPRNHT